MADKTPVRVVFNASNVATGMAEFQSGETVPVANGGTGLSSIGSAGQVLKVNAAGSGLEFGAEGDISITNLVAPTNADLTFTTSGTGNIVLDAVTVRGTTFSAADSTKITIAEALDVTGALTFSGLTLPTSDGTVGQFLKTDGSGTLSFASVSVGDLDIVGSSIASPSNADLTLDPSGSGSIKLNAATDVTGTLTATSLNIASDGATVTGIKDEDNMASDSATKLATQQSIKAFVESGTHTLTNKTLTNPTINAFTGTGNGSITGTLSIANTTTDDSLLLTSTEDSNSGAPVLTLKRNSSSPADADYLGRIKFKGENDADQEVQYGSISGKILDASDGTEDGAIEFNVKKAGSNNIAVRINSDTVKLLNNTDLEVHGLTYPTSDGSAGQFMTTDGSGNLSFASVSVGDFTFTGSTMSSPSNADITLDPSGSGDIQLKANTVITGNLTVSGTQTTLETTTLVVEDPLLEMAKNNSGGIANTMDQGLFFNRGSLANVSFLWDESADEFAFAVTSGEDGTTTGNVTIDSYANLRVGTVSTTGNVVLGEDAVVVFEGASDNTNETTLTVVDPTADRTISLPNKSGTLAMDTDLNFPASTLAAHPAASGDADLGSNLTAAVLDAFGIPVDNIYDMVEPRGSTSTVDLGAFS